MKFTELYSKIFVSEQDTLSKAEADDLAADVPPSEEVPMPEDFNDVEPMPVPEIPTDATGEEEDGSVVAADTTTSLNDYVDKLTAFADTLNNPEGNSLHTFVANLDKEGTPFDGISARTKAEIVRAAEIMRTISEQLKSFMVNAAKKQ